MKITILQGEYIWSEQGHHVLDQQGFAKIAKEEQEVEVVNENQLPTIQAYHESVRPKPVEVVEESSTSEVVETSSQVLPDNETPVSLSLQQIEYIKKVMKAQLEALAIMEQQATAQEQQPVTEEPQAVVEEQPVAAQEEITNG
jgi:hypothetical protein